jgi:DNA polymerase III subunit beta
VELDNQILKITCGKYKAKINSLDPEDFPIIPKEENKDQFSLNSSILKNIISKTLSCVSLNDTRIEFTGININFTDNNIIFASTDSFRLMEYRADINKLENYSDVNGKSIIVPAETLREVNKILSNNNDNKQVFIIIENNQIFFNINDVKIVSRLINGKYPDYNQIIPSEFKTNIIINKNNLLRSIKIASVFTKIKEGEINIKLENNKLIIKSELLETGENEVEIDVKKEGHDQEIIINPRYLIDGLNTIETGKILIAINNSESPVCIKMINEKNEILEDYIYIIMPIKK